MSELFVFLIIPLVENDRSSVSLNRPATGLDRIGLAYLQSSAGGTKNSVLGEASEITIVWKKSVKWFNCAL